MHQAIVTHGLSLILKFLQSTNAKLYHLTYDFSHMHNSDFYIFSQITFYSIAIHQ